MKVVHLKTTVTTVFGLVDDQDDVVEQYSFKSEISKVTPEALAIVAGAIAKSRSEVEAQTAVRYPKLVAQPQLGGDPA